MTDDIILDIAPQLAPSEGSQVRTIKWCDGHWAELMFALKDRGLGDQIAGSPEELSEKLRNGNGDPCWDAICIVNTGAMEIFGAEKIVVENGGCPVCAFANMVQHAADLMTKRFGNTH